MTRAILLLISSHVMVFGAGVWHANQPLTLALLLLGSMTCCIAVEHWIRR